MQFIIVLLTLSTVLVICSNGQTFPQVLTVQERLGIFGTDSTVQLPNYDYATLERLSIGVPGSKRKRLPNLVQYRLDMNGEVLTLNLKPNTDLLNAGCLIHHHQSNGQKVLYPCSREISRCLYTGSIHGHNASWVAANICNGLQGIIRMENRTLHVSPLKKHVTDNGTNSVHVVFRYQGNKHVCGTTDKAPETYQLIHKTRRSAPRRYIEASIVVDASMAQHHGRDIEQYVNTVLNVASDRFQDDSFKEDIALTLKSIHIMDSDEGINTGNTTNAEQILTTFCEWQSNQPDSEKSDCFIFLTRMNIEYPVGDSGTVGLARTSGMCSRTQKCLVVQDNGLTSGLTMAHEIGHLLGMNHDGEGNTCSPRIMSAFGNTGDNAFRWSGCSMTSMGKFLKSSQAVCLTNEPIGFGHGVQNNHRDVKPGTVYNADTQCMLYWGQAATQCRHVLDKCSALTCRINTDDYLCQQASIPVMDGTDCNNTRNWCIKGRCVAMGVNDAPSIDGAWSDWDAEFSPCSRTCGGGVEIKRRRCNNPTPQYKGKPCEGTDTVARLCNLEKCTSNGIGDDCGGSEVHIAPSHIAPASNVPAPNVVEQRAGWIVSGSITGCRCMSMMSGKVATKMNGAECRQNYRQPFSRCIDGRCMNFGCDGRLGSGLDYDNCSVCGGAGDNCVRMSAAYNQQDNAQRFTTVGVIPGNSTGILVTQINQHCFLSVKTNGIRMFNTGPHEVSSTFLKHGQIYMYYRHGNGFVPETLEINGPIPDDIEIQVYRRYDYRRYVDVTPNVTYTFYVPTPTPPPVMYAWSTRLTQQCSKSCGTGTRTPTVRCWGYSGAVNDSLCDIRTKPNVQPLRCNQLPCPATWRTGHWSGCSATCGAGHKQRSVICVQDTNGKLMVVPPSHCDSLTRPTMTTGCQQGACSAIWKSGAWSQCSKTCSEGTKSRSVQCFHDNQTMTPTLDSFCALAHKPEMIACCNMGPCNRDPGCSDLTANCKQSYGEDICVGIYAKWAERNCSKSCAVCSAEPLVDEAICARYIAAGHAICRLYPEWSKLHCPRLFSGSADSTSKDCTKYDRKYCTDTLYRPFMVTYCPSYCGLC